MMGCESHSQGGGRSPRPEGGRGSWGEAASPPPHHQLRGLGSAVSPDNLRFGATWDLKSHSRNTK